mgnify:CR=1 FL=1
MPRVKAFKEDEILNKAMELFWRKGYHATSIQDLVNHLGINRASLYSTYGDKFQLFLKAFHHYRKTNGQLLKATLSQNPEVKTGLRLLFEATLDESAKDEDRKGCFVVNSTTEFIPGNEVMTSLLLENKNNFQQVFYEYLMSGVQNGQLPANRDYQPIALLLFTLYNGIKVVAKLPDPEKKLMKSVDEVLKLLD